MFTTSLLQCYCCFYYLSICCCCIVTTFYYMLTTFYYPAVEISLVQDQFGSRFVGLHMTYAAYVLHMWPAYVSGLFFNRGEGPAPQIPSARQMSQRARRHSLTTKAKSSSRVATIQPSTFALNHGEESGGGTQGDQNSSTAPHMSSAYAVCI